MRAECVALLYVLEWCLNKQRMAHGKGVEIAHLSYTYFRRESSTWFHENKQILCLFTLRIYFMHSVFTVSVSEIFSLRTYISWLEDNSANVHLMGLCF